MKPLTQKDATGIVSALEKVDWNFPRAGTWATALHSLHWFPGNFIPQIPNYLIQLLSPEGSVVADPFCGSCTTGVEATILNRKAWMGDFSPVSYLISLAKLALLTDKYAKAEFAAVELPPLLIASPVAPYSQESASQLSQWFHPDTLDQLARLWNFITYHTHTRIHIPLEMLFSDTLFACASTLRSATSSGKLRRHHWGWVADNVCPKPPVWHDAVKYFEDRLHRAKLISSRLPTSDSSLVAVRREDARLCSWQSDSVDLVVTSPPYLGMIDYTTANRLTYLWYGWEMAPDRALEIGARFRRNSLGGPKKYLQDMEAVVSQIHRILKDGGFCAVVIGSSRKYPDMALTVVDTFSRQMKLVWGPRGRVATRRRVSDRKGTAPSEYICVLRKD